MLIEFPTHEIARFPCLLAITEQEDDRIVSVTPNLAQLLNLNSRASDKLTDFFTPASKIMMDAYIRPLLLKEGACEEVMVTLSFNHHRQAFLLNARCDHFQERDSVFWMLTPASKQNDLYQELIALRKEAEIRNKALETLSFTDELTGLLNRRAFIQKVNEMILQCQQSYRPYALFVMDIDHFKRVNDIFGHAKGDAVLKAVSHAIKRKVRRHDLLARVGGEEFALFTTAVNEKDALILGEKLLDCVRQTVIDDINPTISIGLTLSHNADYHELFTTADRELYRAKARGRDQLCLSEPEQDKPM